MKINKTLVLASLAGACALAACKHAAAPELTLSGLDPAKFVAEVDGKPTALYTLKNAAGTEVCITNYGGRIVSFTVADSTGSPVDIVLGFDSIGAYLPQTNRSDFGAAIGRYANRIAQGRIVLEGDTVQLPQNNFGHCLHGGPDGWQYKVYDVTAATDSTLSLRITSPDGDNNFPGTVVADVTYTLTGDNALDIAYSATTDAPTVINLTNHSYFNLSGDPTSQITDHLLYVNAGEFTPVDSTFMTTGEIRPVAGTPMDFTTAHAIGDNIDADDEQIHNGLGYDHNWVLATAGDATVPAVTLTSPVSGLTLEVYTTEPGVQVYTGNFLDGSAVGKHGIAYGKRAAVCLETQHYPDTPNKPQWPTAVLRPGEVYTSRCIYKVK